MERGCEGGSYGGKVGGYPHLEARWVGIHTWRQGGWVSTLGGKVGGYPHLEARWVGSYTWRQGGWVSTLGGKLVCT